MRIVLVTGGARAGKSRWAEREAARLAGDEVTYVATAEPRDDEMAARVAAHRAGRPPAWLTVEAPLEVSDAVAAAQRPVVLLDCLTLWVSNLMEDAAGAASGRGARPPVGPGGLASERAASVPLADRGGAPSDAIRSAVERLLEVAGRREGTLIAVTNEVGLGIVPANALARAYRDALGATNARVAEHAERVVLLVAGVPLFVR